MVFISSLITLDFCSRKVNQTFWSNQSSQHRHYDSVSRQPGLNLISNDWVSLLWEMLLMRGFRQFQGTLDENSGFLLCWPQINQMPSLWDVQWVSLRRIFSPSKAKSYMQEAIRNIRWQQESMYQKYAFSLKAPTDPSGETRGQKRVPSLPFSLGDRCDWG